jgi:hypothetical protein
MASLAKHEEWLKEAANVKTVGEAMARKDLRNGKHESGSWRPHKWTERRRREFRDHALGASYAELSWWIGEYAAGLAIAELRRDILEAYSRDMLRGEVRTLGELP